MGPLQDPDDPLAVEIQQEMAATYFAGCRKMVDCIEALKAFDRSVGSSTLTLDKQIARRSELLEEAAEKVHFVLIQREAMKLLHYDGFFDDYGISNEVRMRLGTRRE